MMTLTAAIDEAGHLLYAAEVGIEIETVARDSGDWRTNPMPTSEVTLIDTFKFQLAGMAALYARGLASVEDIHYEDFQTVVREAWTPP